MAQLQVEAAPETIMRLWTPANIVTLVRICLVPVFVVALLEPVAAMVQPARHR